MSFVLHRVRKKDKFHRCQHGFCREPTGFFDDAVNAYDGSDIIIDPPQELTNNPALFWEDIIKGVGQEFDNVKDS